MGGCHRRQPTSQAPGEALAQPLAFSAPPPSPTCMADTGGQSVPQRLPDIPPRARGVSTLYDGGPTAWLPGRWGLPREL